jgi:hypothetical protein
LADLPTIRGKLNKLRNHVVAGGLHCALAVFSAIDYKLCDFSALCLCSLAIGIQIMPRFHVMACLLASVMFSAVAAAAEPPPVNAGGVSGLDLKTQLEKGLKARRPVEFQYIEQITQLVASGDLPREMVTTTFVWARKKPSRQLQYFQFALQTRAKKLPVVLPDLRQQAVGISSNGGQNGTTSP